MKIINHFRQTAELNLYEEAAKCLYKIASRKCAKTTETPIVVSLFRDEPIRQILTAANLAAADSSSSPEHYKYLKALCDLLCALGIHLAEVWANYTMKTPPNFSLYLSALSAFFKHPSIVNLEIYIFFKFLVYSCGNSPSACDILWA